MSTYADLSPLRATRVEGSTRCGPATSWSSKEGEAHDLHNTDSEDFRVIGFFSAPQVEQHWTTETWPPDDARANVSPNR
jgi:hypothetical protein